MRGRILDISDANTSNSSLELITTLQQKSLTTLSVRSPALMDGFDRATAVEELMSRARWTEGTTLSTDPQSAK